MISPKQREKLREKVRNTPGAAAEIAKRLAALRGKQYDSCRSAVSHWTKGISGSVYIDALASEVISGTQPEIKVSKSQPERKGKSPRLRGGSRGRS